MSNPMKRRKLHRAALAARGEVKETPAVTPVAAPVVAEAVAEETNTKGSRLSKRLRSAKTEEGAE